MVLTPGLALLPFFPYQALWTRCGEGGVGGREGVGGRSEEVCGKQGGGVREGRRSGEGGWAGGSGRGSGGLVEGLRAPRGEAAGGQGGCRSGRGCVRSGRGCGGSSRVGASGPAGRAVGARRVGRGEEGGEEPWYLSVISFWLFGTPREPGRTRCKRLREKTPNPAEPSARLRVLPQPPGKPAHAPLTGGGPSVIRPVPRPPEMGSPEQEAGQGGGGRLPRAPRAGLSWGVWVAAGRRRCGRRGGRGTGPAHSAAWEGLGRRPALSTPAEA